MKDSAKDVAESETVKQSPILVLAGPTAVGKGTVIRQLCRQYPQVALSVSVTTRPPRPGEVEGVDYFFVSDVEFDRLIATDALLEWAVVHGKYRYGTPAACVKEASTSGTPVLLELDLDGVRQVRRTLPEALFVFLAPPSWEELRQRLVGRGTEDAEEQERRLRTARIELDSVGEFDLIVTNDNLEDTVGELAHLLGVG